MFYDLFVCDKCNAVDSLSAAKYELPLKPGMQLECTECQTGEWHGFFPKKPYDGERVINRVGTDTGLGLECSRS